MGKSNIKHLKKNRMPKKTQPPHPPKQNKKTYKKHTQKKPHQQNTNKIQQTKHKNPNKNPLKL